MIQRNRLYIYINRPTANNCYITQIFKAIFITLDGKDIKKSTLEHFVLLNTKNSNI